MQIRPLEALTRDELIALVQREREQYEAVGAGGVNGQPIMTPAATWRANGEPDPHGERYDCERAGLILGSLTDDELANAAFMNYDRRPAIHQILNGTAHNPIVYMTAVKDRIRWLSRALEAATKGDAAPAPPADGQAQQENPQ